MNTARKRLLWTALVAAPILALALTTGPARADREDDDGAAAPMDPLYAEECGACHVPYPAWALPARSWRKMMGGLADHFGDNAELDADTAAALTRYLTENAADISHHGEAREFLGGVGRRDTPQRITDLSYFKKEHREIPQRAFRENPDLTLSRCDACHTKAAQGSYRERDINIPGVGRWED